jgi:amidase
MIRVLLLASAAALAGCAAPDIRPAIAAEAAAENPVAATRAALARIAERDRAVGAVIAIDPTAMDEARRLAAEGPRGRALWGVPVLIKDNIETAGPLPTTAGSLALADNVTGRDAPLVARLRDAGAVILGKANLSEWANIRSSDSISGWSAVGGQTRNPHALGRNPCGSSSGSAAAVAAGMVDAAIGTETNGSITCPASINGIVGFKPTVGLVSRTHVIPISHSQDTAGPMTTDVRRAAELLTAMAGSDPADPVTAEADARRTDYAAALDPQALRGARIGVMRFATGFGTNERFEEALAALRAAGAELVDIAAFEGRGEISRNEILVLLTEFKAGLDAYLAAAPAAVTTRSLADVIAFNRAHADREMPLFGQDLFERAEATEGLDSEAYRSARATSLRLAGAEGIDRLLREHDVVALVGPTVAPAWFIDAVHGDQYPGGGAGGLAAVAGYPHLTVPMGAVRGLPVGLSFIGPKWADARILSLGYAYEQATRLRVTPAFIEAVETRPDIAPHLVPAGARR